MPSLFTENGPHSGRQYKLEAGTTVIGRHPDCDIVVDVGAVSRHHAQVVEQSEKFFIEDLNSRNGTFVNGDPVHGRQLLNLGDRIQVCDVSFRFGNPGLAPVQDDSPSSVLLADMPSDNSRVMSRVDLLSGNSGSHIAFGTAPEAKLKALIEINAEPKASNV